VRLLLDTHVWLWQLLEPELVSSAAADALSSDHAELFLSPISVWETLVLARRGRLQLRPDPSAWVREALRVSPAVMTPVTHEIAVRSETFPDLDHRDPADRFLLATCAVESLTLVTSDRRLLGYRGVPTLW
jgi:PIN domain nuclease of toxin-antitoxin system